MGSHLQQKMNTSRLTVRMFKSKCIALLGVFFHIEVIFLVLHYLVDYYFHFFQLFLKALTNVSHPFNNYRISFRWIELQRVNTMCCALPKSPCGITKAKPISRIRSFCIYMYEGRFSITSDHSFSTIRMAYLD